MILRRPKPPISFGLSTDMQIKNKLAFFLVPASEQISVAKSRCLTLFNLVDEIFNGFPCRPARLPGEDHDTVVGSRHEKLLEIVIDTSWSPFALKNQRNIQHVAPVDLKPNHVVEPLAMFAVIGFRCKDLVLEGLADPAHSVLKLLSPARVSPRLRFALGCKFGEAFLNLRLN